MHMDEVFWASIAAVIIAVVIMGFLSVKVGRQISKDEQRHNH